MGIVESAPFQMRTRLEESGRRRHDRAGGPAAVQQPARGWLGEM